MKHTMFCLVVLVCLVSSVGCGGGSGSSGGNGGNGGGSGGWGLSARAFNEPGNGADKARVQLVWAPPAQFRGNVTGTYEILRNGTVVGTLPLPATTFNDGADPAHPLTPGTSYNYRIQIKRTGSTVPNSVSPDSGQVTPLVRPIASVPASSQPVNNVALDFTAVPGADTYVFEFSTTPNMELRAIRGPLTITRTGTISDLAFNVSEFQNQPAGTPIYFRVGAANSRDKNAPLSNNTPNGGSFIYSASPYGTFTKQ